MAAWLAAWPARHSILLLIGQHRSDLLFGPVLIRARSARAIFRRDVRWLPHLADVLALLGEDSGELVLLLISSLEHRASV
jgi:hypothetical protein